MRLWSLHPKYLDTKGLVALWREALLAQHVLAGKTKGYKNHPQLERFKESESPLDNINQYLLVVWTEAKARNYAFDERKIDEVATETIMTVNKGQMDYERNHLLGKLQKRDPGRYDELVVVESFLPHPLFEIIEGGIEKWEMVD